MGQDLAGNGRHGVHTIYVIIKKKLQIKWLFYSNQVFALRPGGALDWDFDQLEKNP